MLKSGWIIGCLLTVLPVAGYSAANIAGAPNIIVIMADDLGYGDIGSFGAESISTPHIDQLAANGIRFTQFYSASAICTQSRAGLLTGRYSIRMGIKGVFMHDAHDGMSTSEITIAEQLKKVGYHTGMVGKWHLGHLDRYMPWNQGFDEFYGVPYSNDMANFFFYENQEIIHEAIDQRYLTRRYTDKATDYIERHADQPFFLYLAHSMPHVPLYASPEFEGKSGKGLYGDVVEELDWSTGQLVAKLRELGLLDNTLIVFTSDNGPWLAMGDHGGSAGLLRDGKITAFEGGQRVPTVLYWPAQIKHGRVDNAPASAVDLLPTFSALAGVPLPDDRVIDGEDISGVLTGEGERDRQQFYYMTPYSDTVAAYRDGDWKLKLPRSGYPKFLDVILRLNTYSHGLLLFNLRDDPYEQTNLVGEYPQRVARMQQVVADWEASVAVEKPRVLYMKATDKDHKGYGPLKVRVAMTALSALLIIVAVLYGVYRLIEVGFKIQRDGSK